MAPPSKSNALLILFPGYNTLDVNGPLEVFRKSGSSDIFTVTIASETELTTSVEGAIMKRHRALDDSLIASLSDYDLLIVPGGYATGDESPVQLQANKLSSAFMRSIAQFDQLKPTGGQFPRILLSICTGAIFPANLGIFTNRYCTTHWGAYATLEQYNKRAAAASGDVGAAGIVLPARFVDTGANQSGVQVISSGGISCGIDASLHVVTLRKDEKEAYHTARLLDYAWRKTDGVTFGVNFDGK